MKTIIFIGQILPGFAYIACSIVGWWRMFHAIKKDDLEIDWNVYRKAERILIGK